MKRYLLFLLLVAGLVFTNVALADKPPSKGNNGHGGTPPSVALQPDAAQQSADTSTMGAPDHQGAVVTPVAPAEAVAGIDDATAAVIAADASAGGCWSDGWRWGQGVWPYSTSVTLHTYWCGNGFSIQYRSSWVSYDAYLCDGHDPYAQRIEGGIGYMWVTVEGGAYFNCDTLIPWVTIHVHDWVQAQYWASGGDYAVAWS